MSIKKSLAASFHIVNASSYSSGSGVAIWRDEATTHLYLATALHVVEDMTEGFFIDHFGQKYTNFSIIVTDKVYDLALVELYGVPKHVPVVKLLTFSQNFDGKRCYTIGYPLATDRNSVSMGSIRSTNWTSDGIMNTILISASVYPGNSGGPVFLEDTHQLAGVVSWGIAEAETIVGVVRYTVILQALFYIMYRPSLPTTPMLTCGDQYLAGFNGVLIDPFMMNLWLQPNHTALIRMGSAGLIVVKVLPGSPAAVAGFTNLTNTSDSKDDNGVYSFNIVWGLKLNHHREFTLINQENSVDIIMEQFAQSKNRAPKPYLLQRRSTGQTAFAKFVKDPPQTLDVQVLTSKVSNNVHDQSFQTVTVSTVLRATYYQRYGSQDPSSFGNAYLCHLQKDARNTQLQTTKHLGGPYTDYILKKLCA